MKKKQLLLFEVGFCKKDPSCTKNYEKRLIRFLLLQLLFVHVSDNTTTISGVCTPTPECYRLSRFCSCSLAYYYPLSAIVVVAFKMYASFARSPLSVVVYHRCCALLWL